MTQKEKANELVQKFDKELSIVLEPLMCFLNKFPNDKIHNVFSLEFEKGRYNFYIDIILLEKLLFEQNKV